ncbi:uncharacterized protein BO87DRAFT_375529 [Aspergillus neoniger CBS 115656]|uniref:Uncharacterized protein n=1 Tax=Aspergillus neoniger (strain CBS 115656) TaxID=1448310 RepID=A0A318ZH11_ASPNB|nr:hypothetical protein BO87DRAFT_375529 [Aspergillus neoniger CBS 115656]PYH35342.1 hypothetical protein BO87DRAFT_375529 [Aspergillus neoniger CBS 115656]
MYQFRLSHHRPFIVIVASTSHFLSSSSFLAKHYPESGSKFGASLQSKRSIDPIDPIVTLWPTDKELPQPQECKYNMRCIMTLSKKYTLKG